MPRRESHTLTDAELRLMKVLWTRGRATVGEVVGDLESRRRPAYNTVLTLLRIMERKGYVSHEKAGRAFVYVPRIDRGQARRRALSYLMERLFDNSPQLLVLNLLESRQLDAAEVVRLKALVERAEGGRA